MNDINPLNRNKTNTIVIAFSFLIKIALISCISLFLILESCGQPDKQSPDKAAHDILNKDGAKISTRILPPKGYVRTKIDTNSFCYYLRNLPLKPHGTKVKLYNGLIKPNFWVYMAVVDMDIGTRDLQQCADAVMRLRAEYLYKQNQYDKIHFNFTNGFRCDYSKWVDGNRVMIQGNKTWWKKTSQPSGSYTVFRKYMDIIFSYAGTLSLSKEMMPVDKNSMQIGDVFIQGGSPGHAVIVVDMAADKNGNKVFLIAQSYMPAQDIQILKNPKNREISPWYQLNFEGDLKTPEWTFSKTDLKRFKN